MADVSTPSRPQPWGVRKQDERRDGIARDARGARELVAVKRSHAKTQPKASSGAAERSSQDQQRWARATADQPADRDT